MQVLVSQNQLQLPPDTADSPPPPPAAAADAPNKNKSPSSSSPPPKRPRRAPIPAPAPDSSLRYMLVVLPDIGAPGVREILSHHELHGVAGALANEHAGNVIVGEVGRAQYFLNVLREQL